MAADLHEYWQHRTTGEVFAVKLRNESVIGVVQIDPRDVNVELLPHLPYRSDDAKPIEHRRDEYCRIDGRMAA